mmetsp:Transcript_69018/g.202042  ORF Transcript_69018/g.202042 Transcript_69018/m.202042 type:complete len:260 (+) Transcript_69018:1620-2399(+)
MLEHPCAPRVFHVDEGLVVCQDPLLITQLLNLFHGRLVEVILNSSLLLTYTPLGLLQIIRASVLGDVLHRLILIELPRVVKKLIFETLSVNVLALHAKLYEHVHGVLQQNSVNLLATPLGGDVLQHQREEPGPDPRVPRDVLPEDDQPHLVHGDLLVLGHEVPVHVHEDVADHDHGGLVVVPLLLQLFQQAIIRTINTALRDGLQVVSDDSLDTVVEQFTILMKDKVVCIPVQLLEGQGGGIVLMNLVDGVLQALPRAV